VTKASLRPHELVHKIRLSLSGIPLACMPPSTLLRWRFKPDLAHQTAIQFL
jgi:hypothetical protein